MKFCSVAVAFLSLVSLGFCLKCYLCNPYGAIAAGKSFTPEQCEKNQTELTCVHPYDRCIKAHQKKENQDGSTIEHELRSCANQQVCDTFQKRFEQAEPFGWEYQLACCNTELCNTGLYDTPNALWLVTLPAVLLGAYQDVNF